MISSEDKKALLKLARDSIKSRLGGPQPKIKGFEHKRGVFVTLKINDELRGCIGFPQPSFPLGQSVAEASQQSAFNDPRFPALEKEDLEKVKIEISVLTKPEEITGEKQNLPKKIEIGKDGLIIEKNGYSGLLLPQVPVEWKWTSERFLEQLCIKAGLPMDAWKDKDAKVYKFQADVFSE